jgi:TPR repeat protein
MARKRSHGRAWLRWFATAFVATVPLTVPMIALTATPASAQQIAPLADPALKALHDRMVRREHISFAEMRRLAEAGDSLAALLYGKRLVATNDPKILPEAVHYYSMALFEGRDGAIKAVVSLLDATKADMTPARLKVIETSILAAAARGNVEASSALAEMYLKGTPFGLKRPEAMRLLTKLADRGDGRAALDLSMLYLSAGTRAPDTQDRVHTYLTLASNSADLSVRTMAENLMRQWPRQAFSPPDRPERIFQ